MPTENWTTLIHARRQTEAVELPEGATVQLKQFANIRAVVFDVYGTLFSSGVGDISLSTVQNRDQTLKDTLSDNDLTITETGNQNRFDEQLNKQIRQHQDLRRQNGIQFPEVEIRDVWQDFLQELVAADWIQAYQNVDIETLVIDYESRVNPTQAMPSLEHTLNQLKASGKVLSIISNAQFYTPLLFDTYLQKPIEAFDFSDECSVWSYKLKEGKPSQRLYEIAAEKLAAHSQITPNQVLYVGNDIRNDIWPAQAIGFNTALFAGDKLSLRRRENDSDCSHIRADIEITNLAQILECV